MSLKSYLSKKNYFTIIIFLLVACVISLFFVGYLLFNAIEIQEKKLFSILEDSDLRFLRETIGKAKYYIKDGCLYVGKICLGDGSKEKANQDLFKNYTAITGVNCFVYMRCSDEGLGWCKDSTEIEGGYNEAHYICVCDSMGQDLDKSYVGKKFSKERAEIIEKKGTFSFPYDYLDNGKLVKRVMRANAVKDLATNKIIAIVTVTRTFNDEQIAIERIIIHFAFAVLIIVIIIAASLAGLVSLHTNNIRETVKYISKIDKGSFPNEPLKLSDYGTLKDVEEAVNSMVDSLKYNKRVSEELELAKGIQTNMIPKDFDKYSNRKEFSIYGEMHTAKEVGGDFYDFFMLDNKHLVTVIADVSGKGVPAAMLMAVAKTLIRSYVFMGLNIDEVFNKTNKLICGNDETNMFITACIGVLNLKTGILKYVNAGHNHPLLFNDNSIDYVDMKTGVVLGVIEDYQYKIGELQMKPGDKLLMYTDGVTECKNDKYEFFGDIRFKDFVNKNNNNEPRVLIQAAYDELKSFANGAEQSDDITLLCVKYK